MGVGADTERVQVPDGLRVVVPLAEPRQLRRVAAVEAPELSELVEGELGDPEPLALVEERFEAGQFGSAISQRTERQ